MTLTKEEFWKRVTARAQEQLPSETVTDLSDIRPQEMNHARLQSVLQVGFSALIQELRPTSEEDFLAWPEEEENSCRES